MATKEEKYIVADIENHETKEQGEILGQFRKVEFARQARKQMMKKQFRKKGWIGTLGIFLSGKFVEEL